MNHGSAAELVELILLGVLLAPGSFALLAVIASALVSLLPRRK